MRKFMCVHTLSPNAMTEEQVRQVSQAAQQDRDIRGYRSFINLTEGKILCVLEASSKDALAGWFKKMGVPYDSITAVEIEGDRGSIVNLTSATSAAQLHA